MKRGTLVGLAALCILLTSGVVQSELIHRWSFNNEDANDSSERQMRF